MKHTRKLLVLAAGVVGAVGMAAAGWAYWSAGGSGSAAASVGTLNPPTNVVASSVPATGTVTVTWDTSASGPGAVTPTGYFVQRSNGTTTAYACGSSPTTLINSCGAANADSGVADGTYTYTVTAVYRSWTAASLASNSVNVTNVGPLHHFAVTVPNGATAGSPFNISVTAKDAGNHTVTSYTGSQSLVFTGPDTAPDGVHNPAFPSSVNFSSGVGTASVTLYKSESPTLTVRQDLISGSSGNFPVSPAAANTLVTASGTDQTAGTAFNLTVTAKDPYGNLARGYTGTVRFTTAVTDATATGLENYTFTTGAAGDNGQHVFSVTLKKAVAGGGQTVTATDTVAGSITGGQGGITVASSTAATVTVSSGSGQSATVNTAFTNPLVALVKDAYGNVVPGATVTFTAPASGAAGTFATTNTATTNTSGLATSTVYTANTTAGTYTISAAASGASPATFSMTNTAGSAATVTVSSGSGQSATVNTAFTNPLVALVKDAYGNVVPGATVTFTAPASGAAGTFATTNTATTNTSGLATSTVYTANTTAGTYTISAAASGASPATFSMTNTAGSAATVTVSSGSGQSATVNTAFTNPLVALVKDAYGNVVPGATVTFTAPASGAAGTFATTNTATTNTSGLATSTVYTANTTAGTYTISAAASGASPATFSMTNTAGSLASFTVSNPGTQSAGTAFNVTVTARDAFGNAANGWTSTAGCVVFSGPASSPNATAPIYPVPGGSCSTGQSGLSFNASGQATASITLFKAAATTVLTVKDAATGTKQGSTGNFAVDSKGVVLSQTPAAGALNVPKNSTSTFTINLPSDQYGNPFTSTTGIVINLALSSGTNYGFGTVGTVARTLTITSGPANNTFTVITSGGAGRTSTLTPTTSAAGFTAPGPSNLTSIN